MSEQVNNGPEPSDPSKFLRVVCIIEMIEGGLAALIGVLTLTIGISGFSESVNMPEAATIFTLAGLTFLAYAAAQVIAARSGIQGRYRIGSILSYIAIVLSIVSLVLVLQNRVFETEQIIATILGVVLPVLYLVGVRQSTAKG